MRKIFIILAAVAYAPFGHAQITDALSISSCFVLQTNRDNPIRVASGFFLNVETKTFFITNNHVVGGEFAQEEYLRLNKKPIPKDSITDNLRIRAYGNKLNSWQYFNLPVLSDDKETYIKFWENEKDKKGLMDVVAFSIPDSLKKYLIDTKVLSKSDILNDLKITPSSEIFIVGFPGQYGLQSVYPIWKKGTIASEPDLGISYWVDALTMGGMSGSPVFYRNQYFQTKSGASSMNLGYTPTFLLGIYSAQNYELSIGQVWKLDKVIEKLENYSK